MDGSKSNFILWLWSRLAGQPFVPIEMRIGTKARGRLLMFLVMKFDVETLPLTFPASHPALRRGPGMLTLKNRL